MTSLQLLLITWWLLVTYPQAPFSHVFRFEAPLIITPFHFKKARDLVSGVFGL